MKKHLLFWILAVVMIALLLAGCRKENFVESPQLYLKSAAVNEMTSVQYFKDGKIDQFSYPDNILFKVSGKTAEILSKVLLTIRDFNILVGEKEAFFLIGEVNSKPIIIGQTDGKTIYDMNLRNVHADKLPFSVADFGIQSATGDARFSGLLKAENFIFAVKDGQIMIYDLNSTGDKIIIAKSSIQNDVLTFKVGTETWVLKFIEVSPVGNVFELTVGNVIFACYTLS